eukprot:7031194-Alexandrium_andersonii.AAC.1
MASSPFGSRGVALRWPYLGGVVACRGVEVPPPAGKWIALDLRRMREAAWHKAVDKYLLRASALGGSLLPPGGRA